MPIINDGKGPDRLIEAKSGRKGLRCTCCGASDYCVTVTVPHAVYRTTRVPGWENWCFTLCRRCLNTLMNRLVNAVTQDPDGLRIRADGKDGDV